MLLRSLSSLLVFTGLATTASAIKIELRYDYDTQGFFTTHPEAKTVLRQVADFYEGLLHDSLLPITPSGPNVWNATFFHPGTGNQVSINNLVVPADTLIIFAGGRNLGGTAGQGGPGGFQGLTGNSQAWFDTVVARGQPGGLANPRTDFGPWGGSVTFNTIETWSFSPTSPEDDELPFASIALHEIGHLLGVGTAQSWTAKVSGSNFTGAWSVLSRGGPVPLQTGGFHWRDDGACDFPDGHDPSNPNNILSRSYDSFGTPHGVPQIALMDPSLCTVGPFLKVMTDLDLAALRDIGWQLDPPLALSHTDLKPAVGNTIFTWPSTTGFTYRLQRSTTLGPGSWTTLTSIAGNGTIQQHAAAPPASDRAFYRLTTDPALPGAMITPPAVYPQPDTIPPVIAEGCECHPARNTR